MPADVKSDGIGCPHCVAAAASWLYGGCHPHCEGCRIRELANGQIFTLDGDKAALHPQYRSRLKALYGEDEAPAVHERVMAEYRRIKAARAAMKGTDAAGG